MVTLGMTLLVVVGVLTLPGVFKGGQPASAAGDPVIAAAGDIACDPGNSNFNGGNGANGACMQKATYNLLTQINPPLLCCRWATTSTTAAAIRPSSAPTGSHGAAALEDVPVGRQPRVSDDGGSRRGDRVHSSNANAAGYFRYYSGAARRERPAKVGTASTSVAGT